MCQRASAGAAPNANTNLSFEFNVQQLMSLLTLCCSVHGLACVWLVVPLIVWSGCLWGLRQVGALLMAAKHASTSPAAALCALCCTLTAGLDP